MPEEEDYGLVKLMAVKTQKDSLAIGSVQSGCRVSEVSHRLNRWLSKFNQQGKHSDSALEMGGSKLRGFSYSTSSNSLFLFPWSSQ